MLSEHRIMLHKYIKYIEVTLNRKVYHLPGNNKKIQGDKVIKKINLWYYSIVTVKF